MRAGEHWVVEPLYRYKKREGMEGGREGGSGRVLLRNVYVAMFVSFHARTDLAGPKKGTRGKLRR